jgi:putative zinc finger/helix-turn-helix YgiT family protein
MIGNTDISHDAEEKSAVEVKECPSCGASSLLPIQREDKLPYGHGTDAVTLKVALPAFRCTECGFEFTDSNAEILRHEAVCKHLGVMTPREIALLRKRYELSRAQFAEATRIGDASVARWERGEFIQSGAHDQLLYLLTFPENMLRIRTRAHRESLMNAHRNADLRVKSLSQFRSLKEVDVKLREARCFELRPTGT